MCDTCGTTEFLGYSQLNPNDYPIPQDERGIHKCETGMYPCDKFPKGFHMPVTPQCPATKPLAMNNGSDPGFRYEPLARPDQIVGTGCMNLGCTCANCHGSCKCNKFQQQQLLPLNLSWTEILIILVILYLLYRSI